MKAILLPAALFLALATPAFADTMPCEDALKSLRDAVAAAKLGDADAAAVQALDDKGIERCNADDDKRADGFFDDAMKIVKK